MKIYCEVAAYKRFFCIHYAGFPFLGEVFVKSAEFVVVADHFFDNFVHEDIRPDAIFLFLVSFLKRLFLFVFFLLLTFFTLQEILSPSISKIFHDILKIPFKGHILYVLLKTLKIFHHSLFVYLLKISIN